MAWVLFLVRFTKNSTTPISRSRVNWKCLTIAGACGNSASIHLKLMIALQKYGKCFLFHLKSSSRSRNIQIFVFPSSLIFLPVSHCFRGCLKINVKVYDVINWLNKNWTTHFVWYLGKGKSYDIQTLSVDRVLNKEHFYGKSCRKCTPKASPRTLFNFGK